jgi:nitroreductase
MGGNCVELKEAIAGRRSIRKYKSTTVSPKAVEAVLEAARQAPSWANTQCWSFVVVRDSQTKNKLAETLAQWNPATNAVKAAPVVIVACAELGKAGYYRGEPQTDKGDYWFMFDAALALNNLTLAAYELGLGTVHVGLFDAQKAAQIMGVPKGVVVVELIPLGYPDEQPPARPRKELTEMVFYEKYGQTKK